MASIMGLVRGSKFERIPDKQGVLEELRLTTIAIQAAMSPETAELKLVGLEGKLVVIEGDQHGKWVYSARVVSDQYFRANVGIVLINQHGEVLALERTPKGSGRWQMPQGGIFEGEEPRESAERELTEELGLGAHQVEFLDECVEWLAYELPEADRRAKHGRGQVQKWFLVRFKARDDEIDLSGYARQHNEPPEFVSCKWMTMKRLADETWIVRRSTYQKLASYFQAHLRE